jgi:hypothetical protein
LTGLTAAALRYAAARGWTVGAVRHFVAAFLGTVALQTTWDSAGTISVYVALAAISLGLLTWCAHLHAGETSVPAAVPA